MSKKITIIGIIFLLLIPFFMYQVYMKNGKTKETKIDNAKYITFYDENKKEIGKYKCKSNNCDYAKSNSKNDYEITSRYKKEDIFIINNKYAFIIDKEDKILLYDITKKKVLDKYNNFIKVPFANDNLYIIVKDNLYGVISLNGEMKEIISIDYEFIGYSNNVLVGVKDSKWFTFNNESAPINVMDKEIVYASDKLIITKGDSYFVYDKYKNQMFSEYQISEYILLDNVIVFKSNEIYLIYDLANNKLIDNYENTYKYELNFKVEDNNVNVYNGPTLLKSIALT